MKIIFPLKCTILPLPLKNVWKFRKGFCGIKLNHNNGVEVLQYQEMWDNKTTHYYCKGDDTLYEGIHVHYNNGNLFGLNNDN